jgi:hypothetical protein
MLVDARDNRAQSHWIPACAGMTMQKNEVIHGLPTSSPQKSSSFEVH